MYVDFYIFYVYSLCKVFLWKNKVTSIAVDKSVPNKSGRTLAHRLVIGGFAKSVGGARVGGGTRVQTTTIDTRVCYRTLVV